MKCSTNETRRSLRALWLLAGAGVLALVIASFVSDGYARPPAGKDANSASKPSDANATSKPLVTKEQFMKVIQTSCVRCHRPACASLDALVKAKWIVPGKPDQSPVYKVIGVNRRAGGTYHNLSPADKQIVHDFVEQMKN